MSGRARQAVRLAFLGGVAAVLLGVSLYMASTVAACWPGWSLRYTNPILGLQASAVRNYAIDNPDEAPWPTFWAEETLPLQSDLDDTEAPCILYSGQGDVVWPARFTNGGWPGATDEAGCVVSTALADALWGSRDVVGKQLDINGDAYWVRGIFDGSDALCIAQTSDTGAPNGWQGMELYREEPLSRAEAEAFMSSSGLGQPDTLLPGDGLAAVVYLVCWLPLILFVLVVCVRWGLRQNQSQPILTKVVAFAALVGLSLALPRLLGLLPDAIVPTRWSDFSYWGLQAQQLAAQAQALLAMRPALRDVQGKLALLAAGGLSALGLPLALWIAVEMGRFAPRAHNNQQFTRAIYGNLHKLSP